MVPRVSRPRPLLMAKFGWVLALGMVATMAACTLLVDASAAQCRSDDDCAAFSGSACDSVRHVCVPTTRTPIGSNADGGADGSGDAAETNGFLFCPSDGAVAPGLELLNACTNATCIPFVNRARLRNLADDGSLKPLPDTTGVVSP